MKMLKEMSEKYDRLEQRLESQTKQLQEVNAAASAALAGGRPQGPGGPQAGFPAPSGTSGYLPPGSSTSFPAGSLPPATPGTAARPPRLSSGTATPGPRPEAHGPVVESRAGSSAFQVLKLIMITMLY